MECKAYLEKGKQKNMKKIISNNKGITGIDLTIGIIVLSIFSGVIISLIISNNKGITGIDLTIGIIVLSIFSGVIISLMVNTYSTVVEIRKSANAMAYATIILEKVDEKSFEKVNDSFVSYLEALGEVDISDDYKVEFSTETLEDSFKKAIITVRYDVNGEEKSITINKLKVKEK